MAGKKAAEAWKKGGGREGNYTHCHVTYRCLHVHVRDKGSYMYMYACTVFQPEARHTLTRCSRENTGVHVWSQLTL